MSQSRRLAAIMFADIVGYTAMMQRNEQEGLAKVRHFSEVIEREVKAHQGEVLQFMGDGCLCVFHSAVQAMHAAKNIQQALKSEPKVPLRIGIHIGDIVQQEGNIYGDGVNLASRVESMGVPGSILVTERVIHDVKSHPEFEMASLGRFQFKNVEKPMEVFALSNEGFTVPDPELMQGKGMLIQDQTNQKTSNKALLKPVLTILGILGIGTLILWGILSREKSEDENPTDSVSQRAQVSIAVLPFADMSVGKDQEYLGDGMAEEVLNLLTGNPQLHVISRSSSFSFKGQNISIPDVAQKLSVSHILDGSVREFKQTVRISAQLINVANDQTLWAETWERKLDDVFAIQDEIAQEVYTSLKINLLAQDAIHIRQTAPEAYRQYLQAKHLVQKSDQKAMVQADYLLDQVLKIDSTYAPAWSLRSEINEFFALYGSFSLTNENRSGFSFESLAEIAKKNAHKSIELDPMYAHAYGILGGIYSHVYRAYDSSNYYLEQGLELDPQNSSILVRAATNQLFMGNFEETIGKLTECLHLDPVSIRPKFIMGDAYLYKGDYTKAESIFREMSEIGVQIPVLYFSLCRLLLKTGRIQEAEQIILHESSQAFKLTGQAMIAHSSGDQVTADAALNELIENFAQSSAYQIAEVYGFRQETDKTFEWLEKSYLINDTGLGLTMIDPEFVFLHEDPRWKPFLNKLGLGQN